MILRPDTPETIQLFRSLRILLDCRQRVFVVFQESVGGERIRQWQAWNTVRRAMHHVQEAGVVVVVPKKRPEVAAVVVGRKAAR